MKVSFRILCFCLLVFVVNARAQKGVALPADSTTPQKKTNLEIYAGPRKATLMSALLPGLGQIYNGKYWKVPIVYAALGGAVYVFKTNNDQYNFYRNNLLRLVKDTSLKSIGGYSQSQLQTEKFRYKKYRDFAVIGILGVYMLNIIDANVDAHLKTFDVSDDLSLSWEPFFNTSLFGMGDFSGGIRLTLQLHHTP